jgi:hypothetical protein
MGIRPSLVAEVQISNLIFQVIWRETWRLTVSGNGGTEFKPHFQVILRNIGVWASLATEVQISNLNFR